MIFNFYFDNLNFPDDVREYDHVDIYFEKSSVCFEFYNHGDSFPSRVLRVHDDIKGLKGVSIDG